jgi:hypothetical protein
MKAIPFALAVVGLTIAPIACNAGVTSAHDSSQMSQSGAKIAPPQKNDEPSKNAEKEKEPEQGQKR